MTERNMKVRQIAWRYVAGLPLNGKRRTNAQFVRAGELPYGNDRPYRWSYLPGVAKSAIRILGVAYVILLFWAWWNAPWIDWLTLAVVLSGCVSALYLYIWETRQLNAATRMPWKVSFDKAREYIDREATADRVVVGFAAGMRPIVMDFDTDAPHMVASMGTGAGKSTLLRGLIAQLLHNGVEHITIIDPKLISLIEFQDHPRVLICTTYPEMWAGIEAFADEMNRRYAVLADDPHATFPRRVLIIEEGNSFAAEIRLYWNMELNGKGPAPIIGLLALILFKARQAGMNVMGAYQRLSVQSVGSGDARDQFGFKIMARFSPASWKSLVATMPIPRSPRHKGRGLVVIGEDHEVIQMVGWSPVDARVYADGPPDPDAAFEETFDAAASDRWEKARSSDQGKYHDPASIKSGAAAASLQLSAVVSNTASPASNGGSMQPTGEETDVTGPDSMKTDTPPPTLPDGYGVTMKEAIQLNLVTCRLGAMRSARQRGVFPLPIDNRSGAEVYAVKDIVEWERNRRGGKHD